MLRNPVQFQKGMNERILTGFMEPKANARKLFFHGVGPGVLPVGPLGKQPRLSWLASARCLRVADMFARLDYVALRTPPMPHRLLQSSEHYA
jgi:hypothetical protein